MIVVNSLVVAISTNSLVNASVLNDYAGNNFTSVVYVCILSNLSLCVLSKCFYPMCARTTKTMRCVCLSVDNNVSWCAPSALTLLRRENWLSNFFHLLDSWWSGTVWALRLVINEECGERVKAWPKQRCTLHWAAYFLRFWADTRTLYRDKYAA